MTRLLVALLQLFDPTPESNCLALMGYNEARSESVAGEACVMQVALNRSLIAERSACSIVTDPHQFHMASRTVEATAWQRSQWLGALVAKHVWPMPDFCYEAVFFHQGHNVDAIGRIGVHSFYGAMR